MRIARPAALPIGSTGFRNRLFEAFCLFLVAACCMLVAWSQTRGDDLLDLEAGAVVLSVTSEYDSWPALALLDNNPYTGWASRRGRVAPNTIVVEFKFAPEDRDRGMWSIQGIPIRVSRNSKYVIGVQSLLPS